VCIRLVTGRYVSLKPWGVSGDVVAVVVAAREGREGGSVCTHMDTVTPIYATCDVSFLLSSVQKGLCVTE
jgi:hypothetical protein